MATYKFVCENGHEYTLSYPNCKVCPGNNCGVSGKSTPIIEDKSDVSKNISNLGESFLNSKRNFLFRVLGIRYLL